MYRVCINCRYDIVAHVQSCFRRTINVEPWNHSRYRALWRQPSGPRRAHGEAPPLPRLPRWYVFPDQASSVPPFLRCRYSSRGISRKTVRFASSCSSRDIGPKFGHSRLRVKPSIFFIPSSGMALRPIDHLSIIPMCESTPSQPRATISASLVDRRNSTEYRSSSSSPFATAHFPRSRTTPPKIGSSPSSVNGIAGSNSKSSASSPKSASNKAKYPIDNFRIFASFIKWCFPDARGSNPTSARESAEVELETTE